MDPEQQEVASASVDNFASGLSGLPTETPEAVTPAAQEPVVEQPKYVQITEDEWQATKARAELIEKMRETQDKSFGTAFGKIGGIERTLQQLQAGGIGEVSAADFGKLSEEFPDLAEMVVEGLNSALKKAPRGSDTAELEAKFEARIAAEAERIGRTLEIRTLTREHKDWREVVTLPEFSAWKAGQPVELQKTLDETWDADTISDALTAFKTQRNKSAKQPDNTTRRDRLAAAVTPRGTGGHAPAPDSNDNFLAGVRSG